MCSSDLRTDCRILGGDSGGPLFSLSGRIIGIHSRISQSPDENFHIPIESFLSNWEHFLSEELVSYGAIRSGGFLGVACEESTKGLEVRELVPGGPTSEAGLAPGDHLLRFNGTPLDTREKLVILASLCPPGSSATLDYLRHGKEVTVRITLVERPFDQ